MLEQFWTSSQPSSSRRVQTHEISRIPSSSIPLVPVNPGQEWVFPPPRPEVGSGPLGVAAIARQRIRGGQHGQVMVAREPPDLFHVARDALVAMIDAEAVLSSGRQGLLEPGALASFGCTRYPSPARQARYQGAADVGETCLGLAHRVLFGPILVLKATRNTRRLFHGIKVRRGGITRTPWQIP